MNRSTRRQFLTRSGVALAATSAGLPAAVQQQHSRLSQWRPESLSKGVLSVASSVMVHTSNALYRSEATMSDIREAALMYRVMVSNLHEAGFGAVATSYITDHIEEMASSFKPEITTRLHDHLRVMGSVVPRYEFESILTEMTSRSRMELVLSGIQKHGLTNLHAGVAHTMMTIAAKQPLLLGSDTHLLPVTEAVRPPQDRGRFFSENACFYMDWGGGYLGGMSLPMMEIFLGAGAATGGLADILGVAALVMWGISKLAGC